MSITIIIIIITVAVSLYAWSKPELQSKLILNSYQTARKKEYWRLLTSGFIHADYAHLAFNMFSLYFLGEYLEQIFMSIFGPIGGLVYVLLYLIGIIVSDIPSFLKHRNNPGFNSLGASGGVSAIVFSFILFAPTQPLHLMFIPIGIPAFIYGIVYLIYSWYQSQNGSDNINHDAHFYGAVFGLVFTAIVVPASLMQFVYQISEWRMFG